jgi:MFS family permease
VGGVGAAYPLSFLLAMRTFGGTRAFGFMEAAIGAGYLAGSLTLVVMARRVRKGLVMTIALVVMGSGYAVVGLLDSLPAVLVLFAALGAADAVLMIAVDTYLQQTIPAPLRGRVLGLRFTLTQGVYALGVLSAGALAMVAGVGTLFAAFGAIVLAAGVGGLLTRTVRDV